MDECGKAATVDELSSPFPLLPANEEWDLHATAVNGMEQVWERLLEDLRTGNVGELQVAAFALMGCISNGSRENKKFSMEKIRCALIHCADGLGTDPAQSPAEREARVDGLVHLARGRKNDCGKVVQSDEVQRNVLAYGRSLIPRFSGGLEEINGIIDSFMFRHFSAEKAQLEGFLLTRFSKWENGTEGRIRAYKDPVGRLRLLTGGDFGTNSRKQQLFLRLNRFLCDRDADRLLESIGNCASPQNGKLPPLSIFQKILSRDELVLLALDTVIGTPVRQRETEGSCFATASVGNTQANDPVTLMRLFEQLVRLGAIEVKAPSNSANVILVPCNCYEDQWGSGTSSAEIMHYAIVRTLADAAPLYDSRYFRDPQTKFPQEIVTINELLRAGGLRPHRQLVYEEPRYDSSVTADRSMGAAEEKGARVYHIGLEGEKTLRPVNSPTALRDFIAEVEEFIKKLSGKDSKSLARKRNLESAVEKMRALPSIFTGANRPFRGANGAVPVPGQEMDVCPMPALLEKPRDAEDLFRGWFEILDKYSALEAPRVLVWGEGHVYNLAPEFSLQLMEALRCPGTPCERADRLMASVRNGGGPLLFIDPNWKGVYGVGLCHCGGSKLELFLQREDGCGLRIRPQHPIFYRNLQALA
ncbi:MAG: hypothetical protein LBH53_02025 [Puniceicoccales bacterium]|nr:hypothetical protein [Puniceicoccales bacterium]